MTRYVLGRPLGGGAMAEVFAAVAHGLGAFSRRVAVKRIRGHLSRNGEARAAFFDEAIIASALHHAGIVSILDYGEVDGTPFQVVELVDGLNLRDLRSSLLARGEPPDEDLALAIGLSVAHALSYAHELADERGEPRRIVHRDVSPENILVSWAGDVKLADFGVATATNRSRETKTGFIKGNLSYMAPEQAAGHSVDPRADVFALACVLHWFLRGVSPVEGPGTLTAAVSGSDPPLDAELSDPTRLLLREATHASLGERTRDARSFGDAIANVLLAKRIGDARAPIEGAMQRAQEEALRAPIEDLFRASIVLSGEHDGVRQFTSVTDDRADTLLVTRPMARRSTIRWTWTTSAIVAALALGFAGTVSMQDREPLPEPIASIPPAEIRIEPRPVAEALAPVAAHPPRPRKQRVRAEPVEPVEAPLPVREQLTHELDLLSDELEACGDCTELEIEYLELRSIAARPSRSEVHDRSLLARAKMLVLRAHRANASSRSTADASP